jgi:hypothetical protein
MDKWTPDWPTLESMYADYLIEGQSLTAILLQELQYQVWINCTATEWLKVERWYNRMLKHVG